MSKKNFYEIVLSNNQGWISKYNFDNILLNLSNEYRSSTYTNNEFEDEYHSGIEYTFIKLPKNSYGENKCNEIVNKLKDYNISAYVKNSKDNFELKEPTPVIFIDQIIYPSKKQYDNFKYDFKKLNERIDYYKGVIIIDNNQPLVTRKEFDEIMLSVSKEERSTIYERFEFEESIIENKKDYIFISTDYIQYLNEPYEKLKSKNINCIIKQNFFHEKKSNISNIIFKDAILNEKSNIKENLKIINDPYQPISTKKLNINKPLSFEKMQNFDNFFKNKIIGQDKVIEKIKAQLITKLYEFNDRNNTRPAGIFFFVGPTGVGKTEVCKQLSEFLYNNREINRLDMSEYKSQMVIEKLIGAPNGYVGYEEGGVLTNKLLKNPNAILLFDEIEKADKSVFDLFLQMFDEGVITSNKGEKIILKDTFIILTSNIGSSNIEINHSYDEICLKISNKINDFFIHELNRPEILGRIGKDNIIVFNTINKKEDQYKILDIYFKEFIDNFKENNVKLEFDIIKVYDSILENLDTTKGARDIRNNFDEFKKRFNLALFENKIYSENLKNIIINFNYDKNKVEILVKDLMDSIY